MAFGDRMSIFPSRVVLFSYLIENSFVVAVLFNDTVHIIIDVEKLYIYDIMYLSWSFTQKDN